MVCDSVLSNVLTPDLGTSMYMTQDLGTAAQRFTKYHPEKMIYVVGCEQDIHFAELFKIIALIRPEMKVCCQMLQRGLS